jgi:5-enolpyruvylshikimate-3-phosphate synthase
MKTIYMNHTLNWLHQKGINIEVDDNVEVIQNDEYIVIKYGEETTSTEGVQDVDTDNGRETDSTI